MQKWAIITTFGCKRTSINFSRSFGFGKIFLFHFHTLFIGTQTNYQQHTRNKLHFKIVLFSKPLLQYIFLLLFIKQQLNKCINFSSFYDISALFRTIKLHTNLVGLYKLYAANWGAVSRKRLRTYALNKAVTVCKGAALKLLPWGAT